MIRSMPLEDDLGQSRKETLDLSTALFLAQSLHGGSAALKLCCAHASLGSARVAWSRAKGLLEASRSIREKIVFEFAEITLAARHHCIRVRQLVLNRGLRIRDAGPSLALSPRLRPSALRTCSRSLCNWASKLTSSIAV